MVCLKNQESEGDLKKKKKLEIAFTVVQMKSLEVHITNQKISRKLTKIFMEHDLYLIS